MSAPAVSGRDDPLVAAAAALWPQARVSRVRGRAGGRAAKGTRELLVLPGAGGAGTAIPITPRAAARAVRRISAAATPRHVATRLGAGVALRAGFGATVADRIVIEGEESGGLLELLSERLGTQLTCSLAVGTARVNRKPVLELFDSRGTSRAFVKVGASDVAAVDVAAEAAALPRLARLRDVGLTVPELLWAGVWAARPVLAMTPLPQGVRQRRSDRREPPIAEIAAFAESFAAPARRLIDLPWWERMHQELAELRDLEQRRVALDCWARTAGRIGAPVGVAAWHGDWTPWNMARHRGGLSLWDWERFEPEVPVGLDLHHYAVNAVTVDHPALVLELLRRTDAAWRALPGACGAPEDAVGLYLTAICSRYLRLAQGPQGTPLKQRADLFLRAWELWSR